MDTREALRLGREILRSSLDAEVLLAFVTGVTREGLFCARNDLTEKQALDYRALLSRCLAGEPVAYLTGKKEFFGHEFSVSPATLIPRPETEFFLELILEYARDNQFDSLADIGTGCGAIGLTVARLFPAAKVICSDISLEALAVAKKNALGLKNVILAQSDLLSAYGDWEPEIIVANLPYIGREEFATVAEDVRRYEPHSALFGGDDGLDLYRRLITQIVEQRRFAGKLRLFVAETGLGQEERTALLLRGHFSGLDLYLVADLSGIERFFVVSSNPFNFPFPYHVRKIG